jgi:hypothetical protein
MADILLGFIMVATPLAPEEERFGRSLQERHDRQSPVKTTAGEHVLSVQLDGAPQNATREPKKAKRAQTPCVVDGGSEKGYATHNRLPSLTACSGRGRPRAREKQREGLIRREWID